MKVSSSVMAMYLADLSLSLFWWASEDFAVGDFARESDRSG